MAMDTLGPDEGPHAVEKLRTPLQNAELGLGVEISAASATANKDMQRQQLTGVLTLSTQLYPQMIQMAQAATQAQGTLVGEVAAKAFNAMSKLTETGCMNSTTSMMLKNGASTDSSDGATSRTASPCRWGSAGSGQAGQPAQGNGGVETLPIGTSDIIKSDTLGLG